MTSSSPYPVYPAYPDLAIFARLNKLASELQYRRVNGGRSHPAHVSEHMGDAEIVSDLINLAVRYADSLHEYGLTLATKETAARA